MSIPHLSPLQLKLGRFLHTHRNVADCTVKDNLDSRELLLTSVGKEMDLPLTVSSCWTKMGATKMTKRYLETVVYCPNPRKRYGRLVCGERLLPEHGNGICPHCNETETHDRKSNGVFEPVDQDTMIRPGAQYTDLCLDEEFMSSLYRTWAPSIELLKQDHEDLDVPVDGILSGTSARRLYNDFPDYFKMDIRDGGHVTIIVRRMSDYQEPFHGCTLIGAFSTGGDNDEVINIESHLAGKPDFSRVTHIIHGGKHIKNTQQRQEWLVDHYYKLMHNGIDNVPAWDPVQRKVVTVHLRVIMLNYTADGPKHAADVGIMDQPNPHHLNYALEGFTPITEAEKLCWCLSYNLEARVRSEASVMDLAQQADATIGTRLYKKTTQRTGFKCEFVWSNGNAAHGVQGMPHLSIYRGVVNGWDHVMKITVNLVRKAIMSKMSAKKKKVLVQRQLLFRTVRGARAPKRWAAVKASEKIKDVEDWVLLRSWYDFDGLLDDAAESLWSAFWLCCMIARMSGYTQRTMAVFRFLTRVWMLEYEQYDGILNTPPTYMKNLFKPEAIMKHGLPTYNSELASDNCFKFLMDCIRRLMCSNDTELTMTTHYIRDRLLGPIKRVVHGEKLSRQIQPVNCPFNGAYSLRAKVSLSGTRSSYYRTILQCDFPDIDNLAAACALAAQRYSPALTGTAMKDVQQQLAGLTTGSLVFHHRLVFTDLPGQSKPSSRCFNTLGYDRVTAARAKGTAHSSPRIGSNAVVLDTESGKSFAVRIMSMFVVGVVVAGRRGEPRVVLALPFIHARKWEKREHSWIKNRRRLLAFTYPPTKPLVIPISAHHRFHSSCRWPLWYTHAL